MKTTTDFLTYCQELAIQSKLLGNAPVGAIIVKDGRIVSEGLELATSEKNITRHAEIEAILAALQVLTPDELKTSTLYTTHEPCLMCSYVIRHYGLAEVVYGKKVEDIGGISSEFPIIQSSHIKKWGQAPKVLGPISNNINSDRHD